MNFDESYIKAFENLKKALTSAPNVQAPDWSLPFGLMCDAGDFAVGVILQQRNEGRLDVIAHACRTFDDAQRNYATTDKEVLVVVFVFDKFRSYLT